MTLPGTPTASSAPPQAAGSSATAQDLVHLMEMRDKGLITEEEYQEKRKAVVDRI